MFGYKYKNVRLSFALWAAVYLLPLGLLVIAPDLDLRVPALLLFLLATVALFVDVRYNMEKR